MTNSQLLSIKEVAKKTGLTSRTIRFYEELGLISSKRQRENGLRCYCLSELAKIKRIRELKELLGFSLEEIKLFIEIEENCAAACRKYKNLTNRQEKIALLQEGLATLTSLRELALKRMQGLKLLLNNLDDRLSFLKAELASQQSSGKLEAANLKAVQTRKN